MKIAVFLGKKLQQIGVECNCNELKKITLEGLFTTVTNVNFDRKRLAEIVLKLDQSRKDLKSAYLTLSKEKGILPEVPEIPAIQTNSGDIETLVKQAQIISIANKLHSQNKDIVSLQEILTYGLKGTAAYAHHAAILGKENNEVTNFPLKH